MGSEHGSGNNRYSFESEFPDSTASTMAERLVFCRSVRFERVESVVHGVGT